MKRKQIILEAAFSVFLVVSTPVLANVFYGKKEILSTNVLKEVKVDQKELLFQTIVDLANDKEIQRIILKSQISRDGFFNPIVRFSVFSPQILTKNHLKQIYFIGLMLSKTISKSKIHSILEWYQGNNQVLQKEITAIIEKDATIKGELTQLSNSKCDCKDISGATAWPFPVICTILMVIVFIVFLIAYNTGYLYNLLITIESLLEIFNCPF